MSKAKTKSAHGVWEGLDDLNLGHGHTIPWDAFSNGNDPVVRASHLGVVALLDEYECEYQYRFAGAPSIVIKHAIAKWVRMIVSVLAYGREGLEIFDSRTTHLFTIEYADPQMFDKLKTFLTEGIRPDQELGC